MEIPNPLRLASTAQAHYVYIAAVRVHVNIETGPGIKTVLGFQLVRVVEPNILGNLVRPRISFDFV